MPSTATDRLNGLTTSVAVKAPCKTVAATNITLAGQQTINGISLVEGDRVLAIGQTSGVDNGIYDVSTGDWTRAKDFNGNRDVVQGTLVPVANGTTGIGLYEITTVNPIVIGTTAIVFALKYGELTINAVNDLLGTSFLTTADETALLASSRQLLADSTIGFNDAVAGQRTISTRAIVPTNNQTGATYTLALTDLGKCVEMDHGSANEVTVPPNGSVAFDVNSTILVRQMGAGQTSIVAGSGVTIRTPASLNLLAQYSLVSLHKRGTNEWCLEGGLEAA